MATVRPFPNIKPASRSYTPGSYPQTEFVAQNGAKSVIRYGNKKTDAKLSLGFSNITDSQANEILDLYDTVNSVYDYIDFSFADKDALAGIKKADLRERVAQQDKNGYKLRYRFDGPPTVTSVRPGVSNVQCKFVACLDGD
tara:strand:- start:1 stop:423 length:423 start_codon:yes stop_codon:yes gene_type:complete